MAIPTKNAHELVTPERSLEREDVDEIPRRRDHGVGATQRGDRGPSPPAQMVVRLATAVVQHDALAQQLPDEDRRRRREQERPVRGAEHVHDVVRPERPEQRRDVRDRRRERPHVLHPLQQSEQRVRARVVRQEADLEPRHEAQSLEQPLGRHRLPAEDAQRRRHETDADRARGRRGVRRVRHRPASWCGRRARSPCEA